MPHAQQDEVVEVGRSAMRPVDEVVPVAVRRRPLAAWPLAVPVAEVARLAERAVEPGLRSTDVDDERVLVQEDAGDAAVAREALHRG